MVGTTGTFWSAATGGGVGGGRAPAGLVVAHGAVCSSASVGRVWGGVEPSGGTGAAAGPVPSTRAVLSVASVGVASGKDAPEGMVGVTGVFSCAAPGVRGVGGGTRAAAAVGVGRVGV